MPDGEVRKLFDGLVDQDQVDGYIRLLDTGGCVLRDAEDVIGTEVSRKLIERGMAYRRPPSALEPPWLIPARPDLALSGVLMGLHAHVERQLARTVEGHQRLGDVQGQAMTVGVAAGTSEADSIRVITSKEEMEQAAHALLVEARSDWMTLDNMHADVPYDETSAVPPLPDMPGHVRCRSIYDAAFVEAPYLRQLLQLCADGGEEQHVLPDVAIKMKLADSTAALLPLTITGSSAALLIRNPVVAGALRNYFELLWERGTPVAPGSNATTGGLTDIQQGVLRGLAAGMTDVAIAHSLHASTRTVSRTVGRLMDRLHAKTRFAAGVNAHRYGWIK